VAPKSNQEPSKKLFARHFSQSLITKLLNILLRLVRNALLARILGPADRGLFSLICSIPELIMTAGNAGLSNSAAYHAAKNSSPLRQIFANTNALIVFISLILMASSFLIIAQPWLVKDYSVPIESFALFIAIAIPFMLIKYININILNVLHYINQVNILSLFESLTPLVLFLFLWGVFDINPLIAATWAWFCTLGCAAMLSIIFLKQGFPVKFQIDLQKDLLNYGVRGHFDTLFQKLLLRIDFLFVSSFLGAEYLGYYAMATAAAELLLALPNALAIPMYSFLMRRSSEEENEVTPAVLRILVFVMVVCGLIFAIMGKVLILILFGEDFLPAYEPLLLLLPGVVFLSYCSLIRLDLLGQNMPGTVSIISGVAVIINIILNYAFVELLGMNGVALASTLSYAIAAIGLAVIYSRKTGLGFRETLLIKHSDLKLLLEIIRRQ